MANQKKSGKKGGIKSADAGAVIAAKSSSVSFPVIAVPGNAGTGQMIKQILKIIYRLVTECDFYIIKQHRGVTRNF